MPFGSERHVHRFSILNKVFQNNEKIWIKQWECEYCKAKTYTKLEYLPIDEPFLDPKTGLHKVGIHETADGLYIVT